MIINGGVIGANNRPTGNTANGAVAANTARGVWGWEESTINRLWNQFPIYVAAGGGGGGFQGSTSGYTSGGVGTNVIDKFPFASNANATDVGDLTQVRGVSAGQSSTTSGYTSGGEAPPSTDPRWSNVIEKFPFASNANATDVGDLTVARSLSAGQSSTASGYTSSGLAVVAGSPAFYNIIDKFPFSSDANATDVGDLSQGRRASSGQTSDASGYTSGGFVPGVGEVNTIDKFPFASNANATDVGDITQSRHSCTGQSSTASGYISGGFIDPVGMTNVIDKFPFATNANATDVGDLTGGRYVAAGQSSTASGYTSGGAQYPSPFFPPQYQNIIDKFPFASNANATDVGDLTTRRGEVAGQQV